MVQRGSIIMTQSIDKRGTEYRIGRVESVRADGTITFAPYNIPGRLPTGYGSLNVNGRPSKYGLNVRYKVIGFEKIQVPKSPVRGDRGYDLLC